MKIVFYGRLAQAIGPELEFPIPAECSVAELRRRLVSEYPEAAATLENKRARACVGNVIVNDDYVIGTRDELEFLPPVSGG